MVFFLSSIAIHDKYLLQSFQNAEIASTISAASLNTTGTTTPASNFSYSIWFYIDDWNYRYGETKVIFGRMGGLSSSSISTEDNIGGTDPCPLVSFGSVENIINIKLECFNTSALTKNHMSNDDTNIKTISVTNIPLQKWVNFVISVNGSTADIYLDGKLVKTELLPNTVKVNQSSNVYVTPKGGFSGWTSRFQYFPNPLNPQEVWNNYIKGYNNSYLDGLFSSFQIQLSLIENGTTQSTVTI